MAALFSGAIRRFDSGSAISLEDLLVCMFGGIVIPAFLSTLVLLKGMESGRYLVLLPVISAFLTDAGAYFVGGVLWEAQRHHSGQPQQITGGLCRRHPVRGLFMLLYGAILHQFGGIEVNFPLMVVYGLVGSAITELGICLSLSSSVSMGSRTMEM